MSAYNVFVTAQPATAVSVACTAHFRHAAPSDHTIGASSGAAAAAAASASNDGSAYPDLILAKRSRLEVFKPICQPVEQDMTDMDEGEGDSGGGGDEVRLEPVLNVPIYGRICLLQPFRPTGTAKDLLFVTTEKQQYFILSYDSTRQEILTLMHEEYKDATARPVQDGHRCCIHPDGHVIALQYYESLLRIIQISDLGGRRLEIKEGFNVRLDFLDVIDMTFLHTRGHTTHTHTDMASNGIMAQTHPVIAILYAKDADDTHGGATTAGKRGLKILEISTSERTSLDFGSSVGQETDGAAGPGGLDVDVDAGATRVLALPPPLNGLLVLGRASISYLYNLPGTRHDTRTSGRQGGQGKKKRTGNDAFGPQQQQHVTLHTPSGALGRETISIQPVEVSCVVAANSSQDSSSGAVRQRCIVGDKRGRLFVLHVVGHKGARESASSAKAPMEDDVDMCGSSITLSFQYLGAGSVPSSHGLAFLPLADRMGDAAAPAWQGLLFIGSKSGDSQLIKVHDKTKRHSRRARPELRDDEGDVVMGGDGGEPTGDDGYLLSAIASYPNLGPMVDFCIVDLENQGQSQVVAACGWCKSGSLRLIRNGIGIHEQASVDLPAIRGLWPLKADVNDDNAKILIQTFIGQTRALVLQEDELSEETLPGLLHDEETIHCGNVTAHNQAVQVTRGCIRILSATSCEAQRQWRPTDLNAAMLPADASINGSTRINVATSSATSSQVLLGLSGGILALLRVADDAPGKLELMSIKKMESEIACLDLYPERGVCGVGLWVSCSVSLMSLPSLSLLHNEVLGGDIIPRSLLLAQLNQAVDRSDDIMADGGPAETGQPTHPFFLLVGMGDGRLMSYAVQTKGSHEQRGGEAPAQDDPVHAIEVSNKKAVHLGSQPITLVKFTTLGRPSVFATGDRPTVVSLSSDIGESANASSSQDMGKLLYSNVNLRQLNHVCSFSSPSFPGCLAFANEEQLTIGGIDSIAKLHVRSVALKQSPNRIAYNKTFGGFCVACSKDETDDESSSQLSSLLFVNGGTLEIEHSIELKAKEQPSAIASVVFKSTDLDEDGETQPEHLLVLGVSVVSEEVFDCETGRLYVYRLDVDSRRVVQVAECHVDGAVWDIVPFQGRIAVAVNSKVSIYDLTNQDDAGTALVEVCSIPQRVQVLKLDARGDLLLCGDLMQSASLLRFEKSKQELEEIASHAGQLWTTSVAFLDDDTYLAADDQKNILTLCRNTEATTDEERSNLEVVGMWHSGEQINRFCLGSLVTTPLPKKDDTMHEGEEATADFDFLPVQRLIWVSADGAIGEVLSLKGEKEFARLMMIQDAIVSVAPVIGGLQHSKWREFENIVAQLEEVGKQSRTGERGMVFCFGREPIADSSTEIWSSDSWRWELTTRAKSSTS
mmetsp:Transcript_43548/g.123343  ORF Transcript_43548/g.123343 Transcript_43548/m.123343 type:complete len:1396 (+) Transcript_43548:87-4274(+)